MRTLGFFACHPATQLLYFAAVLTLSLLSMNPVIITTSIVFALCVNLYYCGRQELVLMLRVALPLFVLITLANPLISHRGRMVLFTLFNRSFTLEALLYGAVSGLMLAAVLLWFNAFTLVVNNDRLRFLLGGALPSAALIVTMTLRLIPHLLRRQSEIDGALSLLEQDKPFGGDKKHKLRITILKAKRLSSVFTILLAAALEDSLDTARSMNARGYGTARRTQYTRHRFKLQDAVICVLLSLLTVLSILLYTLCNVRFAFYPVMTPLTFSGYEGLFYLLFAGLAAVPFICDGWEALRWRF
ncbi:energy-coupling factor transporter transmembrane component T [Acetanaerobacterium elongatum]|uniref:Energy-coupling factor transport system permease protein n=1 Tax=Acetanaerobacterium elongatum TaxID=258515 RepID=A0A1G9XXP3_9FIRM|nr:energy-coupling factor transporter transmembrane component T [Acetanaerobacterium elongatum]SDN01510.1 energy-coupling factor transport system permease protein [Acetanaerobacterium elongatum]